MVNALELAVRRAQGAFYLSVSLGFDLKRGTPLIAP